MVWTAGSRRLFHPLRPIGMGTTTVERPRPAGPESGLGGNWMVIVRNDDHNTFDHVAKTLSNVIPGVSLERGYNYANTIHNTGQATVWTGARETAELYWEQLKQAGLTMAPLEQH
jgi:ATP-dependent Clp protease adaptor protein ClpS